MVQYISVNNMNVYHVCYRTLILMPRLPIQLCEACQMYQIEMYATKTKREQRACQTIQYTPVSCQMDREKMDREKKDRRQTMKTKTMTMTAKEKG